MYSLISFIRRYRTGVCGKTGNICHPYRFCVCGGPTRHRSRAELGTPRAATSPACRTRGPRRLPNELNCCASLSSSPPDGSPGQCQLSSRSVKR